MNKKHRKGEKKTFFSCTCMCVHVCVFLFLFFWGRGESSNKSQFKGFNLKILKLSTNVHVK